MWLVLLILFILVLGYFAYTDTRKGMDVAFPYFLRVVVPMLLAGLIIWILQLIVDLDGVQYIIAGIAIVVFYIVFANVFKKRKRDSNRLPIYQHFVGFLLGLARGWLYFGFVVVYLNLIFSSLFVDKAKDLVEIIVKPVNWIVFLEFLG